MNFNLSFDYAALLFLSLIALRYFTQKHFPSATSKTFSIVIVVALLDNIFDIVSSLLIMGQQYVTAAYIFNTLYYIAQIALPATICTYIFTIVSRQISISKVLVYLYWAPAAVLEAVLLFTTPNGLVFRITSDSYTYGPLSWITYLSAGIYLAVSIVLILHFRKYLSRSEIISTVLFLAIILATAAIQIMYSHLLIISLGITAAFMLVYFNLQDPRKMLDVSTDLFNYSALISFLRACFSSHDHFNVVAIRIPGLKRINMVYGMREGREIVEEVSRFILTHKNVWGFRTNNEHDFVVIAKNDKHFNSFIKDLKHYVILPAGSDHINVSFSACYFFNSETLQNDASVINLFERSLDEKVNAGNENLVYEVDQRMYEALRRRTEIENVLNEAVSTAEGFTLNYQPIFDIKRGEFTSVEALVRYRHPSLGKISAEELIDIAEELGIAARLDLMVVKMAFQEISRGTFDNFRFEHLNINLSAATFSGTSTAQTIIRMATEYGVKPGFITFEVTESAAVTSVSMLINSMQQLKKVGFTFAMDDFGSGYASIARELDLDFDMVKLDRSLLYASKEVITSLVMVFKNTGLKVIVEGVENAEQARFVFSTGADMIQGFCYAQPMSIEALTGFMHNVETKHPEKIINLSSVK